MRTSLLFIIGLTACTEPGNDLYGRSDISDAEAWVSPAPAAVDRLIGLALGGLPR